jgi:hypothetical protein
MRIVVFILAFFLCSKSYCQSCDTINGAVVNYIDYYGMKQGNWVEWFYKWELEPYYQTEKGFCNNRSQIKVRTRVKNSGDYRDNVKTGLWEYFYDGGDTYGLNRTELYQDSLLTVKSHNFLSTTTYNSDSTLVESTVMALDKDSIRVLCVEKSCIANYAGVELARFTLSKLDFEQYTLALGIKYQREIMVIKDKQGL